MVHLSLTANYKRQVLQWGVATVHIKEPSSVLEQSNPIKREIREVVMQNAETA